MSYNKPKTTLAFIFESVTYVPNNKIEVIEESYTPDKKPKIAFKSTLQEANVTNANKRVYDTTVCESIVNQLKPKASKRALLAEVDHPIVYDPNEMKRRAGVIELKNCGALIRDISFNPTSGLISGEVETLSGFKGPDLANLITRDGVDIGFSLRALGGVTTLPDGRIKVTLPITPITYDIVSNPSHQTAKIVEFLPESDFSLVNSEATVLTEGVDCSVLSNDKITICENGCCFVKTFEEYILEAFERVSKKGVRFFI